MSDKHRGSTFDSFIGEAGIKDEVNALARAEITADLKTCHWNYRIVQRQHDSSYGLHEVYYHEDGRPRAMSERAVGFVTDRDEGAAGIIELLERALRDARTRLILIEAEAFQVQQT